MTKGLKGKFENPQAVIEEVLSWTGGQPFLTQNICKFLISEEWESSSRKGGGNSNFQSQIHWIVKNRIIDNWESQDDPAHLKTIRDRMLRNDKIALHLLGSYQQILQKGEIPVDGSREQMKLRLTGLVVEQQGKLRVYNEIYANIFNLNWVEQELDKLRLYGDKLSAWLRSYRQDKSQLLAGEELLAALKWSEVRSLSVDDYQFLTASQQLEQEEARRQAQLEQEAARRQAQRTLNVARQRAKKLIYTGIAIMLVFVSIIWFAVFWQNQEREIARKVTKLEQASQTALTDFENAQIEHLYLIMQAGKDLKTMVKGSNDLDTYPTVTPLYVLRTILDNPRFHQLDEFQPGQEGVNALLWLEPTKETKQSIEIATVGKDGTVQITSITNNSKINFTADQKQIKSIDFAPEQNQTFATGGEEDKLKVWNRKSINVQTPQILGEINAKQGGINHARFYTNDRILTTGEDGSIKLWSLTGSKLVDVHTVPAHKDCRSRSNCDKYQPSIKSLNITKDKKLFVSAGDDGLAKLWKIEGDRIKEIPTQFEGHNNRINSANFSPDCNFTNNYINSECKIATASADGQVKIWNPSRANEPLAKFIAHEEGTEVVRFSTTDVNILATASAEGIIKLWNLEKEVNSTKIKENLYAEFKAHQGNIVSFRFADDGKSLATAGQDDGIVRIWNVANLKRKFIQLKGHKEPIYSVRFSPDGKEIATASDDGTVRLWDIPTKNLENRQIIKPKKTIINKLGIQIKSVRFHPDYPRKKLIAAAGSDSKIRIWTPSKLVYFLNDTTYQVAIWSIVFNENVNQSGIWLASSGSESKGQSSVKLWRENGELVPDPFTFGVKVEAVRFSNNGKFIVAVGELGKARLWNIETREPIELQVKDYRETFFGVSFINNDQEVLTAGDDGIIRRWDLTKIESLKLPKILTPLPGIKTYQGSIKNISFSDNKDNHNKIVAAVGRNGTVKLWTLSGQLLADFKGHEGIVRSVNFSEDGKRLVTAGDDKTAVVWEIKDLDALLDEGCDQLKDYLSHDRNAEKEELIKFCKPHWNDTSKGKK